MQDLEQEYTFTRSSKSDVQSKKTNDPTTTKMKKSNYSGKVQYILSKSLPYPNQQIFLSKVGTVETGSYSQNE